MVFEVTTITRFPSLEQNLSAGRSGVAQALAIPHNIAKEIKIFLMRAYLA
jgi:hypothetical protein